MIARVFTHEQFGSIRIVGNADNPMFCAHDVCKALGYSNSRAAIKAHCDMADICKFPIVTQYVITRNGASVEQVQGFNFINESGLYALLFNSRLSRAKAFKHWVTSEVLPSIRKSGYYAANNIPWNNLMVDAQSIAKDFATYFMTDNTGFIKIGKSANIPDREKGLRIGNPTLTFLFAINKDIENELHDRFKDKCINGEWYKLTEGELKAIQDECKSKGLEVFYNIAI